MQCFFYVTIYLFFWLIYAGLILKKMLIQKITSLAIALLGKAN